MNDLISKKEVIELITDISPLYYDAVDYAARLMFLIAKKSPVEAVSVIHGEWVGCDMKVRICSKCREVFDNTHNNILNNWNFCPNCGADMREKV